MDKKSGKFTLILKIIFFVMLAVSWLYFIFGEMMLPTDVPADTEKSEIFNSRWEQICSDGSRVPVSVPGRCKAERNERIVITTTLPETIEDNMSLCYRSNKQDIEMYVDDELRQQYSTDDVRVFGKVTVSMYVFLELKPEDAGRQLTIVTQTDSSYSGIFNTMYFGTKTGIWSYIIRKNSLELFVAILMGILGILCIIYGVALQYYYKKKIALRYLALGVLEAAMWLLANSELRQLIFPNISTLNDMAFLMILSIPATFIFYMNEIQNKRYQKYYNMVLFVDMVVYVVCVAMHLLNIRELADNFMYMAGCCFLSIAILGITTICDIKTGAIRQYRLISLGIFIACMAAVLQIILYLRRTIQFSGVIISVGLSVMLIVAAANTIAEIVRGEREKQRAISAVEAKTRFLANMSHEIRTPINAVMGLNEMILRESTEPCIREYALKIQNASRSLVEDINDVLDLSKIESGKMNIIPKDYQVDDLVSSLVDMITLRAQNKGLKFSVNLDKTMPSVLYGDYVRIRQIITNLLTNAVKYTRSGSVELLISGTICDDNLIMHVAVKDTGIGIKQENIAKLFVDYERIEENRNYGIEGTGLGMSITQQLLSMMGSELKVESEYGKGSVFSFDLVQGIRNYEPVGDISEKISRQATEYSYTPAFVAPEAKILVVDDIEVNRYVVRNLLKQTKIQIFDADCGAKCLQMIQEQHFDLIFLDHRMPQMDGVETLERMKELENNQCQGVPVIALTSNALTGSKEFYVNAGFNDYLSKPIRQDKLEKMLYEKLPKELTHEYEPDSEEGEGDNRDNSMNVDALPQIEGIDWHYAMMHFSNEKLMMDTIENIYYTLDSQADRLDDMEKNKLFGDYRILVHSIKGITAMAGMMAISGVAAALEKCADKCAERQMNSDVEESTVSSENSNGAENSVGWKSLDEEKLHSMNSWLTQEMHNMKHRLDEIFAKKAPGKAIEDNNIMLALLEMIRIDAMDMDIDGLDEKTAQLMEYEYSEEIYDTILKLKADVSELNQDAINQSIDILEEYFRRGDANER